jgi:hypothetical protein
MKFRTIWLTLVGTIPLYAQAQDLSWPQELEADNGSVVLIYQPQVEEFSGNSLEGRAAVSVKSAATNNVPVFGAIWFEANRDYSRRDDC